MDIKTIADLAKLADICRKKGIKQIKINQDGIEFQLGDKPGPKTRKNILNDKEIADAQPTEEDMLYWSSAGIQGSVING